MISPHHVSAIILAAGYSSRMGSFKPLLEIGGESCLSRVVRGLREAGIQEIIIVSGFMAERLFMEPSVKGCRIVENRNFSEGMFSSVQEGARSLSGEERAFFVLPVDIPLVRSSTYRKIIFSKRDEHDVVHPLFLGKRGHPPLLDSRMAGIITASQRENALNRVLEEDVYNFLDVEVADEFTVRDIDTPDDLAFMETKLAGRSIPSEEECSALLKMYSCPEKVILHGRAVWDVALAIASSLSENGFPLVDPDLLKSGCLLHDIAKGKRNHPFAGAALLRENGFGSVADIVETHQSLNWNDAGPLNEKSLLYLADKLVCGVGTVSLEERFRRTFSRFEQGSPAMEAALKRYGVAVNIKKCIEGIIKKDLESILSVVPPLMDKEVT